MELQWMQTSWNGGRITQLPFWPTGCRDILLLQPSSAAAERVFHMTTLYQHSPSHDPTSYSSMGSSSPDKVFVLYLSDGLRNGFRAGFQRSTTSNMPSVLAPKPCCKVVSPGHIFLWHKIDLVHHGNHSMICPWVSFAKKEETLL